MGVEETLEQLRNYAIATQGATYDQMLQMATTLEESDPEAVVRRLQYEPGDHLIYIPEHRKFYFSEDPIQHNQDLEQKLDQFKTDIDASERVTFEDYSINAR